MVRGSDGCTAGLASGNRGEGFESAGRALFFSNLLPNAILKFLYSVFIYYLLFIDRRYDMRIFGHEGQNEAGLVPSGAGGEPPPPRHSLDTGRWDSLRTSYLQLSL